MLYAFDGDYRLVNTFPCSTGEMPGEKTRSGDKKTPEGVYFFTDSYEKKYLSAVYGDRAFPMDYPNFMDRYLGRDGNSIWMHGTNKPIKPRDSNGCIVLANADINRLADYISLNRTPIIVTEKLTYTPPESIGKIRNALMSVLNQWKTTLMNGSEAAYLALYDGHSVNNISWWEEWQAMKNRLNQNHAPFSLDLTNIDIFRHKDVQVMLFDQTVQAGNDHMSAGTHKLFLRRDGDAFRILGDEYLPEKVKNGGRDVYPLLAACRNLLSVLDAEVEIGNLVDRWLTAWSSKDIDTYSACYTTDFRSQGMSRATWMAHKRDLNRRYDYIRVTKDDMRVRLGRTRSTVNFRQTYQSNAYRAKGRKKLILKREDGQWKIFREIWIKR